MKRMNDSFQLKKNVLIEISQRLHTDNVAFDNSFDFVVLIFYDYWTP